MITTLVLLGQVLELRARSQTSSAIKALLGLAPKTARRLGDDGREEDVPLEQVQVGDRLRVRPGEKVPVDGVGPRRHERGRRVDGHRRADPGREGAGRPSHRRHGQRHGRLVMRAERVGAETMLAQIVRMVGEAQRSRAPIQRLADVVSS